jgi:hypothetical protein
MAALAVTTFCRTLKHWNQAAIAIMSPRGSHKYFATCSRVDILRSGKGDMIASYVIACIDHVCKLTSCVRDCLVGFEWLARLVERGELLGINAAPGQKRK